MRLLRINEVVNRVGLGESSVLALVRTKDFPQPVPLSKRAVAWVEDEIEEWMKGRVSRRDGSSAPSPVEVEEHPLKTQTPQGTTYAEAIRLRLSELQWTASSLAKEIGFSREHVRRALANGGA